LKWQGVRPEKLEPWWGQAPEASGALSGSLRFGPSQDPRALEPLQIDMRIEPADLRFRGLEIGPVDATAYAGQRRFVIHESKLSLANGKTTAWLAITKRDDYYGHLRLDLENLDLDQIVGAVHPDGPAVGGFASGAVSLAGRLGTLDRATGSAKLSLRDSDLGQIGVLSPLYDALNLRLGGPESTGYGSANLRLEGPRVMLDRLHYFNRGIEIVGSGQVDDLGRGRQSTVKGLLFGSARPLKDLELPVVKEFDRWLSTLQADAVSLQISGTAGEPQPKVVPLSDISKSLRRLLADP